MDDFIQLDWLQTPLARNTDPEESHAGAEDVRQRIAEVRREALEAVQKHPGMTAVEICLKEDIQDPRRINRRLGELEAMGLVRREHGHRCRVTGRSAARWYFVPQVTGTEQIASPGRPKSTAG